MNDYCVKKCLELLHERNMEVLLINLYITILVSISDNWELRKEMLRTFT